VNWYVVATTTSCAWWQLVELQAHRLGRDFLEGCEQGNPGTCEHTDDTHDCEGHQLTNNSSRPHFPHLGMPPFAG
jgi:hypothetical protein